MAGLRPLTGWQLALHSHYMPTESKNTFQLNICMYPWLSSTAQEILGLSQAVTDYMRQENCWLLTGENTLAIHKS